MNHDHRNHIGRSHHERDAHGLGEFRVGDHTSRTVGRRMAILAAAVLVPLLAACDLGNDATGDRTVAVEATAPVGDNGPAGELVGTGRRDRSTDQQVGRRVDEPGAAGAAAMLHIRDEWADARAVDEYGDTLWNSMADFMYYVLVELDLYWSGVFADNGRPEPWVDFWFPAPGERGYSACTDASGQPSLIDDRALFYCPVSEHIVVSQQAAYDIWTGTMIGPDGQQTGGMIGDFAVAMVLAHEFGHHIQHELGLLGAADTPTIEQHADCLAGVWTASAEQIGILDPGDVEEGMTAAWLVGDSAHDAADHHGTSEQRVAAFVAGYSGATPPVCDRYVAAGLG